jgi:hypothetical protein
MSPREGIEETLAQLLLRLNAISGICTIVQDTADLSVRGAENADQDCACDLQLEAKTDDSRAPQLRAGYMLDS